MPSRSTVAGGQDEKGDCTVATDDKTWVTERDDELIASENAELRYAGDNTIFDSVFKTMLKKTPQLIVPFINEAFGRNYDPKEPVIQFSNEHSGPLGSTVSDSVFRVKDKIYHLECQSTPDANMVVRMVEYDFAIALEGAISAGAPYEMNFPESCVLFLRHTASTPDELQMKVNMPDGQSVLYTANVVKAQLFSSDELFDKDLLLLLPYYLMRYEKALSDIASDESRTAMLISECAELRADLENYMMSSGETVLCEQLLELIIRVSDYLFRADEALRQKVRKAMGGEVLELMRERAERLEREAELRGIELGVERGIEQGIEQGKLAVYAELVGDGSLSRAEAASRLGVTVDQFNEMTAGFSLPA